mgnify:CR=1 FL=1
MVIAAWMPARENRATTDVVTPPDGLLISLADAKGHLQLDSDFTGDDGRITALIRTAADYIENEAGIAIQAQVLAARFDRFSPVLRLVRGPVSVVNSVKYFDQNGALQTVPAEQCRVSRRRNVALIEMLPGHTWPDTQRAMDAVAVEYQAGYSDAGLYPSQALHAARILVRHWYDHPDLQVTGTIATTLSHTVDALINQIRDRSEG